MTDTDVSLLQRWLEQRFVDVNHQLMMMRAAINDLAKIQATTGEIEAIHTRLNDIDRRVMQLELHNPH